MNARLPTRAGIYWRLWLGIVVLALVLRCTVFFGLWGDGCGLSFAYAICTWLPIMVIGVRRRLWVGAYLKQHHPQKWQELYYPSDFGLDGIRWRSPSRWSTTFADIDDPVLSQVSRDDSRYLSLALTVFVTFPIMFLLLTYSRSG